MTINVSTVVDVSIAVAENFPARAGFGTLLFLTAETGVLAAPELTRLYNDIDSVAADWPASSEVVAAATAYFSQTPRPTTFKVGLCEGGSTAPATALSLATYVSDVPPPAGSLFPAFNSAGALGYGVIVDGVTTHFDVPKGTGTNWNSTVIEDYNDVAAQLTADLQANGFLTLLVTYDVVLESLTLTTTDNTIVDLAFTLFDTATLPNGTNSITVSDFGWKDQSTDNDQRDTTATQGGQPVAQDAPKHTTAPFQAPAADPAFNIDDFPLSMVVEVDGVPTTYTAAGIPGNAAWGSLTNFMNIQLAADDLEMSNDGGYGIGNTVAIRYTGPDPKPTRVEVVSQNQPPGFPDIYAMMGFGDIGNEVVELVSTTTVTGLAACLSLINDYDDDWYGLVLSKEMRDDTAEMLAVASWIEARVKVFGHTTNNADVLDATITDDVATQLKDSNFRRTMTTYSSSVDSYPSASILARAFTVNFNQPDSTITLMFKTGPGIPTENITGNQRNIARGKNVNGFFKIGDKTFYDDSSMANGSFFDELHGLDWLQNAIQTTVCGYLLSRTTKVPYTDRGVAMIEQQLRGVLDEAVRNGLIAPGTTVDGEYLANGYSVNAIPVAEINQSDVDARFYPGLSFVLLGAGAIHRVQINGVFER